MRNYAGTCKRICSYNLVYNFLIQLLPLQSSVFVVQFSNAFWHGNEAFKKVVLRMKMLVSHLCCTPVARVSLVLDSCRSFLIRVSRVYHSCCQLDYIEIQWKYIFHCPYLYFFRLERFSFYKTTKVFLGFFERIVYYFYHNFAIQH